MLNTCELEMDWMLPQQRLGSVDQELLVYQRLLLHRLV